MRRLALALISVAALAPAVAAPARTGGERPPKSEIEVLDRGVEPKAKLRLDVEEGDEFPLSLTIRTQIDQTIDGQPAPATAVPAIRQELVIRVEDVARNGRVSYEFEIEDVAVEDEDTIDPDLLERLEEQLDVIADLAGRATVTARGVVVKARLDIPEDADPTLMALLEQVSQQVSNLSVPYPREPLGVGARWRVTAPISLGGIDAQTAYEYELLEFDGNRLVLGITLDQTADPQAVDLPGVPGGTDVRLTAFRITGSGTTTIELTSLAPTSATVSASGEQAFTIESAGTEQEFDQSISLEITTERIE